MNPPRPGAELHAANRHRFPDPFTLTGCKPGKALEKAEIRSARRPTPVQTAWELLNALLAWHDRPIPEIEKGMDRLLRLLEKRDRTWTDPAGAGLAGRKFSGKTEAPPGWTAGFLFGNFSFSNVVQRIYTVFIAAGRGPNRRGRVAGGDPGDGRVAEQPEKAEPEEFYRKLHDMWRNS